MSQLNYTVLKELESILADDYALFLKTFIDDTHSRVQAMKIAVENNAFDQLNQESHSLKGSSSNLGLEDLCEKCFVVETKSKDHDPSHLSQLVVDIEQLAGEAILEINKLLSDLS